MTLGDIKEERQLEALKYLKEISESLKIIAEERIERHWMDKDKCILFPGEEVEVEDDIS